MKRDIRTRAREVFSRAGGDPENAAELAAWGEATQRAGERLHHGVIVADDGEILAHTTFAVFTLAPGAWYVTCEDAYRLELAANEVGLACAALRRTTGKQVIHVKGSDLMDPMSDEHGDPVYFTGRVGG